MELDALVYGNSDGSTKKAGMTPLRFLSGKSVTRIDMEQALMGAWLALIEKKVRAIGGGGRDTRGVREIIARTFFSVYQR